MLFVAIWVGLTVGGALGVLIKRQQHVRLGLPEAVFWFERIPRQMMAPFQEGQDESDLLWHMEKEWMLFRSDLLWSALMLLYLPTIGFLIMLWEAVVEIGDRLSQTEAFRNFRLWSGEEEL